MARGVGQTSATDWPSRLPRSSLKSRGRVCGRFSEDFVEVPMSDTPSQEFTHRLLHTRPMVSPFLEFDLTAEVDRLYRETIWKTGQNVRTLMNYDDFRVVLTVLKAKADIPKHKTSGRISVRALPSPPHPA